MCLIEYPEWDTGTHPAYRTTISEYGSIGAFYDALERGARQLASHIRGGVNQVDMFSAFYRDLPSDDGAVERHRPPSPRSPC